MVLQEMEYRSLKLRQRNDLEKIKQYSRIGSVLRLPLLVGRAWKHAASAKKRAQGKGPQAGPYGADNPRFLQ